MRRREDRPLEHLEHTAERARRPGAEPRNAENEPSQALGHLRLDVTLELLALLEHGIA